MQVVYLVQGSRETLARQDFQGAPFYTLCYEGEFLMDGASGGLASTTASWAMGRNLLLEAARAGHPDAEYYVFCDDDVEFISGDFQAFERGLATTRPAIGLPLMLKARIGAALDTDHEVQRAVDIDEQMYAIHRSVVGTQGVAPLETAHDAVSWYVSSLTFEYAAATVFAGRAHQYNGVELANNGHVWETGQTLYATSRGTAAEFVPVFADHAVHLFGHYDETVIEQFMPPLEAERRAEFDAARRATLHDLRRWDGSVL